MRSFFTVSTLLLLLVSAACAEKQRPPVYYPPVQPVPPGQPVSGACVSTGCNGEMCVPRSQLGKVASICLEMPEHECYDTARCEPQASGQCGWTRTPQLDACLAQAPQ